MAREVEAKLVLSAQDRTRQAFASIERRLKGVEARGTKANRMSAQAARIEQATVRASNAAWAATARIAAPLLAAGGLTQGAKTLASYEDAMIGIAKKGGLTRDQMMKVGEEARALATSGELAVPLEEIMAAYERGAAAGLPLDELQEFARLSAKAADAFEMSATDVGNAAAGFSVTLGIPINDMERYFDLINGLADSGIADESDLINFLDRAGASLKLFGLSAEQAAAYGASLANIKMAPEVAANALSTLTGKLLSPGSETAQIALRNIVGDVDDFQELLKKDANKALQTFLKRVGELDKFRATELLGGLIGAGFDDEILRLASAFDEVQRNLEYAAGNSWFDSLSKSYQLKLTSLSSQWQLFRNEITEATIDAGTLGLPILKEGLEGARNLVREIGDGFEIFGENIDQEALRSARESLASMAASMSSMTTAGSQESAIVQFFRTLADVTNDIAANMSAVESGVRLLSDPFGLDGLDLGSGEGKTGRLSPNKSYLGGFINVEGGSLVDRMIGGISGAASWANDRNAAAREAGSWQSRLAGQQGLSADLQAQLQSLRAQLGISSPEARGAIEAQIAMIERSLASIDDRISAIQPSEDVLTYYENQTQQRIGAEASSRVGSAFGDDVQPAIDGLDQSSDALRQAMEASGAIVTTSGTDAGARIQQGAQAGADAISQAAQSIENAGRSAAAAISAVRIQLPNGQSVSQRPNANLGQSMPDAGTPGG